MERQWRVGKVVDVRILYTMNLKNQALDSPEWHRLYNSLYAYAGDLLKKHYGPRTAMLSKTVHDYVGEAILKHLAGEDNYDSEKGPLDFYLKKYVIRQAVTNDARSQIPALNSKKGLGTASALDIDERLYVSDKAFANPMADDDDKVIRTIIEREINGDDVVEQIYLAVYDEDFGIKDRAEICEAFGIKYSDFDNGTRRFKNVLRKVYLKEI